MTHYSSCSSWDACSTCLSQNPAFPENVLTPIFSTLCPCACSSLVLLPCASLGMQHHPGGTYCYLLQQHLPTSADYPLWMPQASAACSALHSAHLGDECPRVAFSQVLQAHVLHPVGEDCMEQAQGMRGVPQACLRHRRGGNQVTLAQVYNEDSSMSLKNHSSRFQAAPSTEVCCPALLQARQTHKHAKSVMLLQGRGSMKMAGQPQPTVSGQKPLPARSSGHALTSWRLQGCPVHAVKNTSRRAATCWAVVPTLDGPVQ